MIIIQRVNRAFSVSSQGEVQTTSTNNIQLNAMTITPPAGRYFVSAFAQPRHFSSNGITWYGLYVGGSQVSNSEYQVIRGGNQGNVHGAWYFSGVVDTNGSQVIEIRWRSQSGTARTFGRSLSLVRVS